MRQTMRRRDDELAHRLAHGVVDDEAATVANTHDGSQDLGGPDRDRHHREAVKRLPGEPPAGSVGEAMAVASLRLWSARRRASSARRRAPTGWQAGGSMQRPPGLHKRNSVRLSDRKLRQAAAELLAPLRLWKTVQAEAGGRRD
jgi:hypothetical protein